MRVEEHTDDVGGVPVFWRSAGDAEVPVLYLHGVPDSSDLWVPFLERSGGLAPDLPGFGRSGKRADLDYTIEGYARFVERFLAHAGAERVRLVLHDWGAVGLAWAQRAPQRVERLVLVDTVPFVAGYRWHRTARVWRAPVLGELAMGAAVKPVSRFLSREANATPGPMPAAWFESVWAHNDQGTQRAILKLYRASPPARLAQAGARLGELTAPALVLHGARDPYIPPRFAAAQARALGGEAETDVVEGAGHWPWLDRPELVERIAAFAAA